MHRGALPPALLLLVCASSASYIVTIADVHLDWGYTEHSSTDCVVFALTTMPCCHRTDVGSGHASPYGSPKCDASRAMVDAVLRETARSYPSPAAVFYVGDSVSHVVIEENDKHIIRAMTEITDIASKHFPEAPLIPAFGNHDVFLVNQLPDKDNLAHLENIADVWSRWISDAASQETIKKGAYYTTLLVPGIRILTINTQYYSSQNLQVRNKQDPQGQKAWAQKVLEQAESANESVWIVLHIPPGDPDMIDKEFNDWYVDLVYRFSSTIKAQLAGHTHGDEIRFIRNGMAAPAAGHMYILPALNTYTGDKRGLWPAVRVWDFDPATGELLDYVQFNMNLTAATEENATFELVKAFSAREEWGILDLSTKSWESVIGLNASQSSFAHYWRNKRWHPDMEPEKCNSKCEIAERCLVNYPKHDLQKQCQKDGHN